MENLYLKPVQFNTQINKCLQCPLKPCEKACPAGCSPHDFIAAAKNKDLKKAAEMILSKNPLGETCGLICPDKFCQRACLRANLDGALPIAKIQAYIMKHYRENYSIEKKEELSPRGKIAVIGSGPAGMGAASVLLDLGYCVDLWEKDQTLGGALNMIPPSRLSRQVIAAEWNYLRQNHNLCIYTGKQISSPVDLLVKGYLGVIAAIGEQNKRSLDIEGKELTVGYDEYLSNYQKYAKIDNVAVIGGGEVAADCADTAIQNQAKYVEMFVRRRICDMRISSEKLKNLCKKQIDITPMTRISKIEKQKNGFILHTSRTQFLPTGELVDLPNSTIKREGFSLIICALGTKKDILPDVAENILYAGDCLTGSSSAVEALASGKKAAQKLHRLLSKN